MCEVRVIQTLQQFYCFDKKASLHRNEKKQNKTQAALRSSVKLEKATYKEPRSVTLQTAIPYRGFSRNETKPEATERRKSSAFHNLTSLVSLVMAKRTVYLASECHRSVTVVESDHVLSVSDTPISHTTKTSYR